ncbi:hypothetical protein LSTR_LSTR003071 [Laodelphax striatellus]|uniref:Uncharacterized protein n=1 Tax=Laodelphax striatellus TaxID=195883 RepID=A0A482WX77_LAOST|nr:hypothetical protein LSTR_LSTR003071 [Laodelphax striatellus]
MVFNYNCHYVFHYPIEKVMRTVLSLNIQQEEMLGLAIQKIEEMKDLDCIQTEAARKNFVPDLLRETEDLKVPEIKYETEFWVDKANRSFWIRSRNLTWSDTAHIWQTSTFTAVDDWTNLDQEVAIGFDSLGRSGQRIENALCSSFCNIFLAYINEIQQKMHEDETTNRLEGLKLE